MLELIGQLATVAFVARLGGPSFGSSGAPLALSRVTSCYLGLLSLVTVLASVGALSQSAILLDRSLVREELQLWRLGSAFLYTDGLGAGFALQLWFFGTYSTLLEKRHFPQSGLRYTGMLAAGVVLIAAQALLLAAPTPLALGHALTFYAVALWSRTGAAKSYELLRIGAVRAAFVPWCLLAGALPLVGAQATLCNTFGIAAALAFDAAVGLPPPSHNAVQREAAAAAAAERVRAASAGGGAADGDGEKTPNSKGSGGRRWGRGAKKKEAAGGGGYPRTAQLVVAGAIVLYHAGARLAERRAERSSEMRVAKGLRAAMDLEEPQISALISRATEGRAAAGATVADPATIFAVWGFAVEHWAQALAHRTAPISINAMDAADPEATRQAVWGALARAELPADENISAILPELYRLMGISHLLPPPEATPHLAVAVRSYRQNRAQVSAAHAFIRNSVYHGDQPEERAKKAQADEIFSAVNATLVEYDLPHHMTDLRVLEELLGLLELPRDALSFRIETLLLDAIRAHRANRAVFGRTQMAEMAAKLTALLHNDSTAVAADGTPRLTIEETWSAEACNETAQTALNEMLHWADGLPADADDEMVWAKTLDVLGIDSLEGTLHIQPDGGAPKPLLATAFAEMRRRRADEEATQRAYNDLIALVRAEDASLVADDTKKRVASERYDEARATWLASLLAKASELGVPAAADAAAVTAAPEGAAEVELLDVEDWDVNWEGANVSAWAEELAELRPLIEERKKAAAERAAAAVAAADSKEAAAAAEARDRSEHYARLLQLPSLIDATLSGWLDPGEDMSDKEIFRELMRLMGLPDAVEGRLMRTMVEGVKQHRLRREREEVEHGDWSDLGPENLVHRTTLRSSVPDLPPATSLVNAGGDGNDFAVFIATLLLAVGAHARVTLGCSPDVTLPPPAPDGPPWAVAAHEAALAADPPAWPDKGHVCGMFAEVRMGKVPMKLVAWVRTLLPGSKWLGKAYHYRLDRHGYVWLNLDWVDTQRVQRPGVPYKPYATQTTYYPSLLWETEGLEVDSAGAPKPKHSPSEALLIGVR